MSEMIGGIVVACSACFSGGVPYVGRYVWYHNQYGAKVRIFCHRCGAVSDKTERKGIVTTAIQSWNSKIDYPFTPQEDLPF